MSTTVAMALLLMITLLPRLASAGAATDDHQALMSFRSLVTEDPSQALGSWGNQSIPMCRWRGVSCGTRGRRRGRVVALDLPGLGLLGAVAASVGNLTYLRRLDLGENRFHGAIPSELGRLAQLEQLSLQSNLLAGEIPQEIGNITNLVNIDLSLNGLTGPIPDSLGGLKKLQYMSIGNNKISGSIPSSLGNLSSLLGIDVKMNGLTGEIPASLGDLNLLTTLSLTANSLTGSIPSTLGNLNSLAGFYLNMNQLEGSVPPSIYNLSSLHVFTVDTNNLTGSIPAEFKLVNLQVIAMNSNQFHGAIPEALCNASMLEQVQLGGNFLSGVIPKCLGANMRSLSTLLLHHGQLEANSDDDWEFISGLTNCSMLRYLELDNNKLQGMLPNSVVNLSTSLISLGMGNNMLQGEIPHGIGNLVSLQYLHLQDNFIHGAIPESIGNLRKLGFLNLSGNNLSGTVPETLGNLTTLNRLYLYRNMISGAIPSSLRNCPLEILNLSFNQLVGAIPKEIFLISTLSRALLLQGNMLSGAFPPEVGNLVNIGYLDMSHNMISGLIPDSIARCASLQYLGIGGNLFEGTIPASMSEMRGIVVLDLSRNNLSGDIPTFLEGIKGLTSLNISFNNFHGKVPEHGIFLNTSRVEVEGNYGLCGGIPQFSLPPCPDHHAPNKWSHKLVLAGSAGGAAFCVVLVLLLVTRWKWRSYSVARRLPTMLLPDGERMVRVSYADLARATSGFASENLVGTGSFGSVYIGTMMAGDQQVVVAVKVLNLQQRGASQSFAAECETLRSIRHRNLVKVLTACSSIDFRGHEFKALVFEFMPNGNLDQCLHHDGREDGIHEVLTLAQRIDIAIDVACALGYFHENEPAPIAHCDLKPSNILLDGDMVAHVGDFGLARFLHQEDDTTPQEISSGWATRRGTIGYAAPEYGQANEVSVDGDVYSYGILLLEMFTGRRPTDGEFLQDLGLRGYVEGALEGEKAVDVVDPRLLSSPSSAVAAEEPETGAALASHAAMEMRISCIASALRVGIACSTEAPPAARMQIGDAARELVWVRNKHRAHL